MIYYSLKIVTSQNQFITVLYIYKNIYKTKYNNTNKNNNLSKYFITKTKKKLKQHLAKICQIQRHSTVGHKERK